MSFELIKGPSWYFSGSKMDPPRSGWYINKKIFDLGERKPSLKQRRYLLNLDPVIGLIATKSIFKHKRYYPNRSGYAGGRVNVYAQEARTTNENRVIHMLVPEPVIRNDHLCDSLKIYAVTDKIGVNRVRKIKKLPLIIYQRL